MFVDLMQDVYHTFSERFMKAQLVLNEPEPAPMRDIMALIPPEPTGSAPQNGAAPTKRYNAFGILEDIAPEESAAPRSKEPKPRNRKDRK